MRPRYLKLWRDLQAERGRVLLMMTAVALSIIGVGSVLGGYGILTREVPRNYLSTHPAEAALELPAGVDEALLARVRSRPNIASADAGEILLARARVGSDYRPLLLFVVDDFQSMRLNTFERVSGTWPPPEGSMLIERSAIEMLEARSGQSVWVKPPHGSARSLSISGVVHDPGLAPAWQEREGYGYITRATLQGLGERDSLDELRVTFRDHASDVRQVDRQVSELADWLGSIGHPVEQARVPPLRRHPHQTQMMGVLFLMLSFGALSLVLSAVLVATSMDALLARQMRELGVMKALGARTWQLASMYALFVILMGAAATAMAIPLGVVGARGLAAMCARMLNLELASVSIPWWSFLVEVCAGIAVPLLFAALPILRSSRISVRAAMDQHGVAPLGESRRPWFAWAGRIPALIVRAVFRRRGRLLLTLGLLSAGGAMFMTALNIASGWERIVATIYENRHYDVEVRLNAPAAITSELGHVPGVKQVEAWGYSRTAFWQEGRVDIVRTYPDGSHGSLAIMGVPADTSLVTFPLLAGRWLREQDDDGVVLNHFAAALRPGTRVGDQVVLSVAGKPTRLRVVGIVEEVGSPGTAYVTRSTFARASGEGTATKMLRIASSATSILAREQVIRDLERELERLGVSVEVVVPLVMLRTAMGDHVVVLIRMLLAMAGLMMMVGMLGLASTMATSVVERTREIGVLKTLGATPARVSVLLLVEAGVTAALSWCLATLLALPLSVAVGKTVGELAFRLRLPLVIDAAAVTGWLVMVLLAGALCTWLPARRAAQLTVHDALGRV